MNEPRTEAGRRLLAREAYNSRSFALIEAADILAIEAEALDVERLESILRARLAGPVRWIEDNGRTQIVLNASGLAVRLWHLYETGDVVSGVARLAREGSEEAAP